MRIKLVKDGRIQLKETDIKRQIKSYLKQLGVFYWHNLQGLGCYPGLPDIMGVYDKDIYAGKVFAIEVKTEKGKLSENQIEFKYQWEKPGLDYCIAHSFDEFLEFWKNFTEAKNE
jgi:hypothetical protein